MNWRSPYPGLRPFRRDETDLFFGREEQVDQLLERLGRSHFLAVVGTSGCGKSSLVKAGMIAALEAGFMVSAGTHWRIAEMRPGEHPMKSLTEALLTHSAPGAEPGEEASTRAFLYAALRRGPLGLLEILQETPLPPKTNLLLLVDQFEEIFRFGKRSDTDEDDAFISLLLATAGQKEIPVYVVITMRSDFLGDCARFSGLPEAMNDNQFLTPAMTREQRRTAIEAPARVFGGQVEPLLVNRILNDMGPDPAQLPLMQHVLMRMWTCPAKTMETVSDPSPDTPKKTLSVQDYTDAGGIADALSKHADEVYDELDVEQQRICEVMFRCLSERSADRRDTRRLATVGEIAEVAGEPWEKVRAIADAFRSANRSLVMPPSEVPLTQDTVLDISHESLIRCWKRLNRWVEQEAESAEYYLFLGQSAKRWKREEAGLWVGGQLDNALGWKQRQNLAGAWSRRYGADFDQVEEFLKESELQWKETQLADKERAQSELEQKISLKEEKKWSQKLQKKNRIRNFLIIILLLLVGCTGWLYFLKNSAQADLKKLFDITEALHWSNISISEDRKDEQAALVGRQAFILTPEKEHASLSRADKILRTVLDLPYFNHIMDSGMVVDTLAISPDSRWLAAGGQKTSIRLWDLENRQAAPVDLDTHLNKVSSVAFSPDGRLLASAGVGGDGGRGVSLWEMKNIKSGPVRPKNNEGDAMSVAFSHDGRLASAQVDGIVKMWHVDALSADPKEWKAHEGPANAVAFSPDGLWLASGGEDKMVKRWDLQDPTNPPASEEVNHESAVFAVAFSADGRFLASAGYDEDVRLWNLKDRLAEPKLLRGHTGPVLSVAFSNDGRWLVSAGYDKTVMLWDWDLKDGSIKRTDLNGHYQLIRSVVFSANGRFLASAGLDKDVRLWEAVPQHSSSIMLAGNGIKANAFAFDSQSTKLASAGALGEKDNFVLLWDLNDPKPDVLKRENGLLPVDALAFSPRGPWLASAGSREKPNGSFNWEVCIWDLEKTPLIQKVHAGDGGQVIAMAFSGDGKRLVTADTSGFVRLWGEGGLSPNWEEWKVDKEVDKKLVYYSVALSPDGRWLASGGNDETVKLWDLQDPTRPRVPQKVMEHGSPVSVVSFSPDGRFLASASSDKIIRWDMQDKKAEPREFSGHKSDIFSLRFLDHERLAAVGYDNRVWVWKFTPPIEHWCSHELRGFTNKSNFSPDGRWLATRSDDSIRLHLLKTEELAERVCKKVWWNMSTKELKQIFVAKTKEFDENICRDLPQKPGGG